MQTLNINKHSTKLPCVYGINDYFKAPTDGQIKKKDYNNNNDTQISMMNRLITINYKVL